MEGGGVCRKKSWKQNTFLEWKEGEMLVFVFTEDRGLGDEKMKVIVAPFAYDSTSNVGRKRKARVVCMDIRPAAKIEGKRPMIGSDW